MRKLASVRRIDGIKPIPGADAIETAVVGGWSVVVKKGEFSAGDLAVYLEIDSWVPHNLAPFLSKNHEPKEYNGVKGERLRTVKLRGQISQGLLLSVGVIPEVTFGMPDLPPLEGEDVTQALNIQKWEAAIPAQLAGQVRGNFPCFIPKTDQERIQNLTDQLMDWQNTELNWEVTEKLDGSSMTVYVNNNEGGVCSRNLELVKDSTNTFWRVALELDLIERLRVEGGNLALQGELIGEGIQGNPYKIKGQTFYLFDVYDIDNGCYLSPIKRRWLAEKLKINHVPVVETALTTPQSVTSILEYADGASALNPQTAREGLVFKSHLLGGHSFKAISNAWLLKNE